MNPDESDAESRIEELIRRDPRYAPEAYESSTRHWATRPGALAASGPRRRTTNTSP